jgi:hypothetical protein
MEIIIQKDKLKKKNTVSSCDTLVVTQHQENFNSELLNVKLKCSFHAHCISKLCT